MRTVALLVVIAAASGITYAASRPPAPTPTEDATRAARLEQRVSTLEAEVATLRKAVEKLTSLDPRPAR